MTETIRPIVGCKCWAHTTTPAQLKVNIEIVKIDMRVDGGWYVYGRRYIAREPGPNLITGPLKYFIPDEWLAKQHRGRYYNV